MGGTGWGGATDSGLALMELGGRFGNARVAAPKDEEWGATVTYAWDPCGVLLHFTQFRGT